MLRGHRNEREIKDSYHAVSQIKYVLCISEELCFLRKGLIEMFLKHYLNQREETSHPLFIEVVYLIKLTINPS